jgi:hypothetical protein
VPSGCGFATSETVVDLVEVDGAEAALRRHEHGVAVAGKGWWASRVGIVAHQGHPDGVGRDGDGRRRPGC